MGRRGGGNDQAADVWEYSEGDLDNIGCGATSYGSDDDWSYAEVRLTLTLLCAVDIHTIIFFV